MKLKKSPVRFEEGPHKYYLNDVELSGITSILSKQLFPHMYDGVPEFVLNQAAETGSYIHRQCEAVDNGEEYEDIEAVRAYIFMRDLYDMKHEASEYLVSDLKNVASCIDKVYRVDKNTFDLADIKTTSEFHYEYVSWQLSFYAYLFELQNPKAKVNKLYGIWVHKNKSGHYEVERIEVERKPDSYIIDLLFCHINNLQYEYVAPPKKTTLPANYLAMEESMLNIIEQEKETKQQKKELTEGLMQAMVQAGAYNWEGNLVKITRKKDSIRKQFDKEAFERDYPGVYEQYMKDTPVVGSITFKAL